MGQQESSSQNPSFVEQQQLNQEQLDAQQDFKNEDFEFDSQRNDPIYGDIKLMRHKRTLDRLIAVKQRHCTTKEEFDSVISQYEQLKYINHPNIIKILQILSEKDEGFCSQVFLIRTVFEYIPINLKTEVLDRVKQGEEGEENIQFYTEEEIVHILQEICAGLSYLKSMDLPHEDVTMQNVFIGKDYDLKRMHKLHIPKYANQKTHFQKVLFENEEELFLSPELYRALGEQNATPEHDIEKSDIFSIGIIALQLCLLQPTNECYNSEEFSINHEVVQEKLQQIADQYSEQLAQIIISFLETEEENRATFEEALQQLAEHPNAKDIEEEIQRDYQLQSPETKRLLEESRRIQSAMKDQNGNYIDENGEIIEQQDHHDGEGEEEDMYQEQMQQEQELNNMDENMDGQQQLIQQDHLQHNHNENGMNQDHQVVINHQEDGVPQQQFVEKQKRATGGLQSKKKQQMQQQQQQQLQQQQMNQNIQYNSGDQQIQSKEQIQQSLKNIDQMVQDAMRRSDETKQNYQQSENVRLFMNELLNDEIFVPITYSPNKKYNQHSHSKSNSKVNRSFRPTERWKI